MGSDTYVEVLEDDTPISIAERELAAGRLPFYLKRQLPNGQSQNVRLDTLIDVN